MTTITIKWLDEASCLGQGSELFYSDNIYTNENRKLISEAKSICKKCPVAANCLQYSINNEEAFGVWGSFSSKERNVIKKYLGIKEITIEQAQRIVNKTVIEVKSSIKNTIFVKGQ